MQSKQVFPFALLCVWTLGGCASSETADQIAKLQEQIGRMAQQLSETKKQVDGLQEANQQSVRSLENLAATVESLTLASSAANGVKAAKGGVSMAVGKSQDQLQGSFSSGRGSHKPFTEQDVGASSLSPSRDVVIAALSPFGSAAIGDNGIPAEEPQTAVADVSCSQVWKLIGQGKSPEAAARALGVAAVAVHACEQKVGRGGESH